MAAFPPERVRVPGQEEVAQVVQWGTNVGTVYCAAVYFPETGECRWFAIDKLETVD